MLKRLFAFKILGGIETAASPSFKKYMESELFSKQNDPDPDIFFEQNDPDQDIFFEQNDPGPDIFFEQNDPDPELFFLSGSATLMAILSVQRKWHFALFFSLMVDTREHDEKKW